MAKSSKTSKTNKLTRKEAKAKVLKTKVGKNTKTLLNIFEILFILALLTNSLLTGQDYVANNLEIAVFLSGFLMIIFGFLSCYFDGKMDGLIASYKDVK